MLESRCETGSQGDLTMVKTRATPKFLSVTQEWQVAKFCIESKGVVQDKNGEFNVYRVPVSTLMHEFNAQQGEEFKITAHHIKKSMETYHEICVVTQNLPKVPVVDDSSLVLEETIKLKDDTIASLKASIEHQRKIIEAYAKNMSDIRAIASTQGKTDYIKKFTLGPGNVASPTKLYE